MKIFTPQDVVSYYDDTEPHYRMFWKFEQSLGLHYGIWDKQTKSLHDAIMNNNVQLARLGRIQPGELVLDAGCGVGGSSIYLAKTYGCKVTGITLSQKQAATASNYAVRNNVNTLTNFEQMDYTSTSFPDEHFDVVWALESMQTAPRKEAFLKEASRVLKPGGRLLIADLFKSYSYNTEERPSMKTMLNGWAITDLLTEQEFTLIAKQYSFELTERIDVTSQVGPTVNRLFCLVPAGFLGTVLYNTFVKKASYFSRIHYKTYYAQFFAYRRKLWEYKLMQLTKAG